MRFPIKSENPFDEIAREVLCEALKLMLQEVKMDRIGSSEWESAKTVLLSSLKRFDKENKSSQN